MVALIIVSFQGIIYVAAMLTSPCSPPLFARYAEILTRTSTEHDIEIRHNLLIGFGNISDVKGRINTMNGAIAFCGVTIELTEKGSSVIQVSSSYIGFLCC